MFESTAIALYVTDRFPKNGLGPLAGDAQRGAYLSWLACYSGVLEPAFMSKFMNFATARAVRGAHLTRPAYARALTKDAG